MPHTICTFNVNNLFVRYRFGRIFPGDVSGKSAVSDPYEGFLPMYDPDLFREFRPEQRELAARAITANRTADAAVVCLQEVESLIALRTFNEGHFGTEPYPHALLIDSHDFRQIDVAILSRLQILNVRTHVDELAPRPTKDDPYLFSRDCLEVDLALGGGRTLTLFVNHLKSKFVDFAKANTKAKQKRAREDNDRKRKRQSSRIVEILRERYPGNAFDTELFAVLGDLNDEPSSDPLKPLMDAGLVPLLERIPKEEDRWTHWYRSENSVAQLDHVLLSPALDRETHGAAPRIERRGVSFSRILRDGGVGPKQTHYNRVDDDPNPVDVDFRFPRFAEVTPDTYASDHCPILFEVPS